MNLTPYPEQVKCEGLEYIYGDAGKRIPLSSDTRADLVYSVSTLWFVRDKIELIAEAVRVLKIDGVFRIRIPKRSGIFPKHSNCVVRRPDRTLLHLEQYILKTSSSCEVVAVRKMRGVRDKSFLEIRKLKDGTPLFRRSTRIDNDGTMVLGKGFWKTAYFSVI